MVKISVVIATKNEENNIGACLESVKWADEIVVVDDTSTDGTIQIAEKYTPRIFVNDSRGDFHKNKNFGAEQASGEWILSLDADEIIPKDLAAEIKEAVNSSSVQGYYLNRRNFFLGKWIRGCGWYPDYILRLFRKGAARWPLIEEDFHGTPKADGEKRYLKYDFLHYSYVSFEQYIKKFNQYSSALARQEYSRGTKLNFPVHFLFKPCFVFLRKYLLMRGYVDGFRGFFISLASAMTVFMTYAKLWEKKQKTLKNK